MIILQCGEHKYVMPMLPQWCAVVTPEHVASDTEIEEDDCFMQMLLGLHNRGIAIGVAG